MGKVRQQAINMKSKIITIECFCGYIATFETLEWTCPECGRKYQRRVKRQ